MNRVVGILMVMFIGTIQSCKTPNLVLSENLKEQTAVYEVRGRNGIQFNQVIHFGGYTSSKIKRGWNLGYSIPFIVHFKGAKEKLNYVQHTPFGKRAQVACIGKFEDFEYELLQGFFGIELHRKNVFAGNVKQESGDENWNFVLYEPDGNTIQDLTSGYIEHAVTKEKIQIEEIRKIEGQANWVNIGVKGYEFHQNGKAIAAVSLLNRGRVWMHFDLDEETKLVLSSVMTALMVRHNLESSFEENE